MLAITIKLDAGIYTRVDRIMDYLEGKQQKQVDALVASLRGSTGKLRAAVANVEADANANAGGA